MILDDIVRDKRVELAAVRARVPLAALRQMPRFHEARRGFRQALQAREPAVIAEIKKASPSKGVIRADFDPVAIATAYEAHGAAAISVLTEERYFQGRLDFLAAVRDRVELPLLRKDFLFDPYQLYEARAYGADAVLLIVAILSDAQLSELAWLADELNLAVLMEVHDHADLDRALAAGAPLIGINNRDLRTFHTTLAVTESLLRAIPSAACVVSESGFESGADIRRLHRLGVRAFLIGEACMRAPDPGVRLAELLADAR